MNGGTFWIDVCQSDGNLLAGDGDSGIKIFDKRVLKIIKTFGRVHSSKNMGLFKQGLDV